MNDLHKPLRNNNEIGIDDFFLKDGLKQQYVE